MLLAVGWNGMVSHQMVRAVICSASNPQRSYADTNTYEKALTKIDKTIAAFSETRILRSQANIDINTAIADLEVLAQ